jgi:hypothetical protein
MIRAKADTDADRALWRLLASSPGEEGRLQRCCSTIADWASLSVSAEWHGVLGILHRHVTAGQGLVPPDVGAELRRRSAAQRLFQSQNARVLEEVLEAFRAAGVEAIPLKGPVLGERLYGDPALRVSNDLDLMVAREQVPSASAALIGLGYQGEPDPEARQRWRHQHHLTFLRRESPPVELHFRLIADFGVVIPSEEFLARCEPYRTGAGCPCRVLAPEDELLFLVLHAAGHLFERLAWLYDVKALLLARPDLDWQVVVDRAKRLRVDRAFGFAVNHVARRMAIELPEVTIRSDVSRPNRAALAAILAAADHSSRRQAKILGHLFRLMLCDGPAQGARYLGYHLHRVARR